MQSYNKRTEKLHTKSVNCQHLFKEKKTGTRNLQNFGHLLKKYGQKAIDYVGNILSHQQVAVTFFIEGTKGRGNH